MTASIARRSLKTAAEENEACVAVVDPLLELAGQGDVELHGEAVGHTETAGSGQWPRGGVGGELRASVFLWETPGTEGKKPGERGKMEGGS